MAETNKTTSTSTRGRKPKQEEVVKETKTEDMTDLIRKMQEQINCLQSKLEETNKEKENSDREKNDLQKLLNALDKSSKQEKQLPKKVKVMSLVPNKYNLSTEKDGEGKIFSFEEFGDIVTMKTSELEEILSIQKYRTQAEQGYFYILDKDIVEDQELLDYYEKISNKETLEKVMVLSSDECVEIFCGLDRDIQESLAMKIAEKINAGERVDRNRISDISMRTDIDIEELARKIKR